MEAIKKIGLIFACLFGAIMKTVFSPIVVLKRGTLCITAFYALGLLQALGLYVGFYIETYLIIAGLAFVIDEFTYLYLGGNITNADYSYKPIYWALKGIYWWTGFYWFWYAVLHK